MNEDNISQFSAASSMSGYLFQCRYALLESLRRLGNMDKFTVSIETLDDVVFEQNSDPKMALIQLKHHKDSSANLTDASPDLWKTLRIWCELLRSGKLQQDFILFLVTTAEVSDGSISSYLKKRDIETAIERLNATALTSGNKTNKEGYDIYKSLSNNEKIKLLESVYIVDSIPLINDIDKEIEKEIWSSAKRDFLSLLVERLEGWWFRRVINQLTREDNKAILSEEIEAEISELREQFTRDSLPIDGDLFNITIDKTEYDNYTFVRQLKLININDQRIGFAIKDYYRAFTQRSRWMRERLIMVGELEKYENRLIEEWERYFERMRDELGDKAAEEAKEKEAQKLYNWVESDASFSIRPNCHEAFITRGSFQMLADDEKVGWHLEFKERLKILLEVKVVS